MDVEVLPTRESVPGPPPAATYVVVDTYRFSSSVVALLEGDATRVRPAATPETAREYAGHDGWIAGGEPGDDDPAFAISTRRRASWKPTSRDWQPASTRSTVHRPSILSPTGTSSWGRH